MLGLGFQFAASLLGVGLQFAAGFGRLRRGLIDLALRLFLLALAAGAQRGGHQHGQGDRGGAGVVHLFHEGFLSGSRELVENR